jgi:hypothetical protein
MKYDIQYFFRGLSSKLNFVRIRQERRVPYMKTNLYYDHISLSSSYNQKISDKIRRENHTTNFMSSVFSPENRAACEIK